jgi:phosphatidylserine decarboxylase
MTWQALREARHYLVLAAVVEALLAPLRPAKGRLLAGTAALVLFFFRDPRRDLDPDPDTVYAPADGVIVGVDTVADEDVGGEALRISTFLALYDVHVNRSPYAGRIADASETPGGYAPAFLGRSTRNHRKRLVIDGSEGGRRVVLVQIAGMLARRISSWAWRGDAVTAGQRVAIIHFGSRAEVLVAAGAAEALVAPGERVRAGVSPIARFRTAA